MGIKQQSKEHIEKQIDKLLKDRQLLFQYRDEEAYNGAEYRKYNIAIKRNTLEIGALRYQWRVENER